MNKILLNPFVEKQSLRLTFFVLFSLLIYENVFAQTFRIEDYVKIERNLQKGCIEISAVVYDYTFGAQSHRYLCDCKFEVANDGGEYKPLMEINTLQQIKSNQTKVLFKDKLEGAQILFKENVILPLGKRNWPDNQRKQIEVTVPNSEIEKRTVAKVGFTWRLDAAQGNVRYVRISGLWRVEDRKKFEIFTYTVYDLNNTKHSELIENAPGSDVKIYKNESVMVFKESKAMVIKGAYFGANIKVYNPLGVEIKSVISNNDVVKINLPAKQFYFVHIGKSQFKVSL